MKRAAWIVAWGLIFPAIYLPLIWFVRDSIASWESERAGFGGHPILTFAAVFYFVAIAQGVLVWVAILILIGMANRLGSKSESGA